MIKKSFFIFYFLAVLFFFLWTASNGKKIYLFNDSGAGSTAYQVQLADSFLMGQVSLLVHPSEKLLGLSDPYNPILNEGLRLHDASLYKEKYYLYFSPVPSLLITIPYKFITGGENITDALSAVIFAFVGYIASCLVFKKLITIMKVKLSPLYELACLLLLLCVPNIAFILRRSDIYEICSLSAYAFLMLSFYFFLKVSFLSIIKRYQFLLFLFGLSLALAVASRPNQLLSVGMMIISFIYFQRRTCAVKWGIIIWRLIVISCPMTVIFCLMAWYNYIRFDSIFEFGFTYQLRGEDMTGVPLYSLKRMPLNIFVYLFHPYQLDFNFPFVHPTTPVRPTFELAKTWYTYITVGWFSYPISWLLLLPLFISGKLIFVDRTLEAKLAFCFILMGLLSMCCVSLVHGECQRYMLDFTPALLISSLVLYLISLKILFNEQGGGVKASQSLFYFLTILTCILSLFISITGPYDEGALKLINPALFDRLYYFFR